MQIIGKPEKAKSREPLILPGLWLITQVLLPSGSNESNLMWVQVPFSAPNGINPNLFIVGDGFGFILFCEYPNLNKKLEKPIYLKI